MAYSAYQYSGGILYPEHASQIVIDSSADLADIDLDVVAPGTRVVDCSSGSMYILSPGKEWKLIQNNVAAASKSVVTESASGDIAVITDGANDVAVKSLVAEITPVQSGSGDPSPDNIRPISGRTGLTVTMAGKNLGELVEGTAVSQQRSTVTYTDGGVSVVSTAAYGRIGFAIPVVIGQHYTVSFKCKRVGEPYSIQFNDVAEFGYAYRVYVASEMPANDFGKKSFSFVANTDVLFVGVYPQAVDTGIYIEEFQIETGDTATPYTPYVATTTYPITWESIAGTVYGGTLDAVSGVLTVTHASYDLAALDWSASSPSSHIFRGLYPTVNPPEQPDRVIDADAISSEYTVMAYSPISANDEGRFALGKGRFVIIDYRYSTTPDFVAHAADVQMVAKLATPQTYQLTPTEVRTLLGGNTIYTDAGDVSVEYIADTKLYIDNKIAELQALVLEN